MAFEWIKNQSEKSLSGSALKILEILAKNEEVSATDLKNQLQCSTRTIHYALKTLQERQIIEKKPYLYDMRQTRYVISRHLLEQAKLDRAMLADQARFFSR
jgi:DNA-binding MarR family transcriptional regulator